MYTLTAIQPNILKLNDNFVVCDAGGGTVDLITYKVTQLSPLQVEESVVGSGGLCGSTYLNRRSVAYLSRDRLLSDCDQLLSFWLELVLTIR